MQSRMATSSDLKNNFLTEYKIPDYMMSFNDDDIISGKKFVFNLIESFSGLSGGTDLSDEMLNLDAYRAVCVNEITKHLQNSIQALSNKIESIQSSLWDRFIKREALKKLNISRSQLIAVLNSNLLSERIDFIITPIQEDLKIPFFKLDLGQVVFLVVQDPVSYMKIEKATVTGISLVQTSTDQMTNCDYEYSYSLATKTDTKSILYNQFRRFDGSKCLMNYNYALFVNLDEAKTHSIKVLEGIKNNVNMKIKDIEDFNE